RYTRGIFKFINQKGKDVDLKSDFVLFEFKEMTEEIRPIMMLVLLEFIKTKFNQDKDKKMLVLDEAWRMLKSKQEADYVEGFARTFRKRNGGLILITQSVAELKDSPEGKAVLANTAFRYILKTENIVVDETCKLFGLNESEREVIANAKPGEGILVWDDKHYKVNIHVDPKTHELITTNPEEMKKIKEKNNSGK
ncbi:ATP-binding protein, partial [Candidatus Woesearchaeota archaeon]|nr:ATP-binding protein [Candidatus Woesearchaeota archaeon]